MSVDKYFSRKYKPGVYDCFDFAREVWRDLTGINLQSMMHARGCIEIPKPVNPCLVFMERAKFVPHVGIFIRGRVLHIHDYGVEYQPMNVATRAFETVRFYI